MNACLHVCKCVMYVCVYTCMRVCVCASVYACVRTMYICHVFHVCDVCNDVCMHVMYVCNVMYVFMYVI